MSDATQWQRVTRGRCCPVCGKPDWCLFAGDPDAPAAAICARVESAKRAGEGGWLHSLRNDGLSWPTRRRSIPVKLPEPVRSSGVDFDKLAAEAVAAVEPDALERLADDLGLAVAILRRFGVGWSRTHRAWCFPMRDAAGGVVGIRLRLPSGRKLSIRGGREGLFLPEGLAAGARLLVAEGATDAAALVELGFLAIGRPSCRGGLAHVVELVRRLNPVELVIVADGDAPGQAGAEHAAAVLVGRTRAVRVICPPAGVKDAREWKRSGATTADVQAVIDAAAVRKIKIMVKTTKGRME